MSRLICSSAIGGAAAWIVKAEAMLADLVAQKGEDCPVGFPDTTYSLPVIYSFTGRRCETPADLRDILKHARSLLPPVPGKEAWLPYLGGALDAGVAALFACEVIEACKYRIGPHPVDGIWLGAAGDVIMRERGIEFVDGTAPGFAAVTGAAPDAKTAVRIARELQEKNIYVFMGGSSGGVQFAEQLHSEGVQLGWETRLVPFGADVSALIYALGFANRAALSFGGVAPGDIAANLMYNKNRIFAFVLALGEVTAAQYAVAAGVLSYGFPVIADTDIPEVLPSGICTYEHVVSNIPHEQIVEKALEVRGCKIKIVSVPVPVSYGAAFEGERIRKENTHAEFGGNKSIAFEFVTSVDAGDINDGEIEVIGPDIDTIVPGSVMPLAIWVEVAGRKMQPDFEPILERQIHHLVNGAEGIWHMGQRDIVWTRVSKDGFAKGLRLRHYGDILHARLLADYPAIVDKVKVTLITDEDEVRRRLAAARKVYDERNRRLEAMTDESVDTFYSCLLCQSFAPDHVCVITPERLGLCGAYNWLDGKAAYEIDETGPNQPLPKGECLDPVKGIWAGINEYVYINSHKSIEAFSAYSIMDRPMTSCGCFEAIVAYVPECNGVMIVNREFAGETPIGMTFSTLAGSVGGGVQTPGFIGCGKVFLTSRKFMSAEGGFARVVWMPSALKEALGPDLQKRFAEQGLDGFMEKIADETVTSSAEGVREFMEKAGHPALRMDDMALYAEAAPVSAKTPAAEQEAAPVERAAAPVSPAEENAPALTAADIGALKASLAAEVRADVTREVVGTIIQVLSQTFLGGAAPAIEASAVPDAPASAPEKPRVPVVTAKERLEAVKSVEIPRETWENTVWTVKLGHTRAEGGTRAKTYTVGGANTMPFHLWEGTCPHPPLIAMEVFDVVSEKYPPLLRECYRDVLGDPADMARFCVEHCGADLISVRLDGTHPERGNRTAAQAVELVGKILQAVGVPLIITGHNVFEKNNEVLKAVAQAFAGENLLLNWVEQENYRTIAGAAIAYGHSLVSQSPIDVNIGKQMNILLTNMDLPNDRIVMDPMTGAVGYGIEYTYSVMERICLTGLGGDAMLCAPMIVSTGQECVKVKEFRAPESAFPAWGELSRRAALWELTTAVTLMQAGADILTMYHPDAAAETRKAARSLMDNPDLEV